MSDFKNGPVRLKSHSTPAPNFVGGLSIGNRFWKDRLGVMLAGSIQNTFRGTERTYNSVKMASGEQAMYISNLHHRYYSIHDLTSGLHAKIDLTLPEHKLEWYNMYVRSNSKGVRYDNGISTEYIAADSYTQDDEVRSTSATQSIFATNLKGTHHLTKDFTVDWSGIFSQAKEEDPDRTYITLTNSVSRDASAEGDVVGGSIWNTDKNITKTLPKNAERRFQHNKDTDWAGYINSHTTHISATALTLYGKPERNIAARSAATDTTRISSILPTSRRSSTATAMTSLPMSTGCARLRILNLTAQLRLKGAYRRYLCHGDSEEQDRRSVCRFPC